MILGMTVKKRRRVTVLLDSDLNKKLRLILVKRVKNGQASNGFSAILGSEGF